MPPIKPLLPLSSIALRRISPSRISSISAVASPHVSQCHPSLSYPSHRSLHTTLPSHRRPVAHNKEQVPEQAPSTDFESMDVLGNTPVPATSVTACLDDGFVLNSGARITGSGALLVGGEAFRWTPWQGQGEAKRMVSERGVWDLGMSGQGVEGKVKEVFGLLDVLWPRPDLLILGVGKEMRPVSKEVRKAISELGIRVEVLDTRNAAAQFNLLATERGVDQVAAALVPVGWKD